MAQAEAFRIAIPESALLDLRDRLSRTRWPDEVADAGWDYGVPLPFLKDLVAYWQERFDWRSAERTLNSYHHFRARIDLRHFARIPRGGHFPALEEPALLAEELRAFFRPLRGQRSYSARRV